MSAMYVNLKVSDLRCVTQFPLEVVEQVAPPNLHEMSWDNLIKDLRSQAKTLPPSDVPQPMQAPAPKTETHAMLQAAQPAHNQQTCAPAYNAGLQAPAASTLTTDGHVAVTTTPGLVPKAKVGSLDVQPYDLQASFQAAMPERLDPPEDTCSEFNLNDLSDLEDPSSDVELIDFGNQGSNPPGANLIDFGNLEDAMIDFQHGLDQQTL